MFVVLLLSATNCFVWLDPSGFSWTTLPCKTSSCANTASSVIPIHQLCIVCQRMPRCRSVEILHRAITVAQVWQKMISSTMYCKNERLSKMLNLLIISFYVFFNCKTAEHTTVTSSSCISILCSLPHRVGQYGFNLAWSSEAKSEIICVTGGLFL